MDAIIWTPGYREREAAKFRAFHLEIERLRSGDAQGGADGEQHRRSMRLQARMPQILTAEPKLNVWPALVAAGAAHLFLGCDTIDLHDFADV